ncbi:dipeptidyl aminopeptidase-like protein 6 isoform x1 [Willisornis vidua]|uniref:Dipeptidyl aminopeptidase-like protein 6 isoform x1 n=1 Tax=Willisornis vidua TaxID=1566151 RepID=A0ABQ9CYH8_9PASS|nr:dipeptidyl aminopeptidase-like protein 6 isoform x1 [Willisornis vidua]
MASLYQRFSGKINTSRSFPVPPEASHLLGAQSNEEDGAAGKTSRPLQQESSRPRFQYQSRSDCEEEDIQEETHGENTKGIIVLHNGLSDKVDAIEAAALFYCELHHKQHLSKHIENAKQRFVKE